MLCFCLGIGSISIAFSERIRADAEKGEDENTAGSKARASTTIIKAYEKKGFDIEVLEDGLYELTVEYAQPGDNTRDILINVEVDGSFPFAEAKNIILPRIYENEEPIRTDANGNEIAPRQAMVLTPVKHTLMSTSGFYDGNYGFPLKKGTNHIEITCTNTNAEIFSVTAAKREIIPSYKEYIATHPGQDTAGHYIVMQAELAERKTTSMLYPTYDRSNVATQSDDGGKNNAHTIRINTAGGEMWKQTGQWMSWSMEVPEDGYYNFGVKYRQRFKDGLFTSRKIYIDGEVPFDALNGVNQA